MQYGSPQSSSSGGSRSGQTDFAGRFVFPYDAEDIKAHKWFKGLPWERLHQLAPPFIPSIRSPDDTQYFDEDEPVTDFSDSDEEDNDQPLPNPETSTPVTRAHATKFAGRDGADDTVVSRLPTPPPSSMGHHEQSPEDRKTVLHGAALSTKRAGREAHLAEALEPFHPNIQHAVRSWIAVPYDSLRLRNFELQVDVEPGLRLSERDALKALVRQYGRKERKRPRDRLLRDPATKKAVLEERKRTAFLGYDWKRIQPPTSVCPAPSPMEFPVHGVHAGGFGLRPGLPHSATTGPGFLLGGSHVPKSTVMGAPGAWAAYPIATPGHAYDHLAAMRDLHGGRLSMN